MSTENNKQHVQDVLEHIRPLLEKVKVKKYTIRKMLNGDFKIRFKVPGNNIHEIFGELFLSYKPGIEIHIDYANNDYANNIVTITKKRVYTDVQNSDTISKN